MVVKTKLVKVIIFFNSGVIPVKCSASQKAGKYILFKMNACKFGT